MSMQATDVKVNVYIYVHRISTSRLNVVSKCRYEAVDIVDGLYYNAS